MQDLFGLEPEIAALKDVVRALTYRKARYRSLLDVAGVGTTLVELSSCVIAEASKAMAQMLGYTPSELVDRKFRDLVALEDRERYLKVRKKARDLIRHCGDQSS